MSSNKQIWHNLLWGDENRLQFLAQQLLWGVATPAALQLFFYQNWRISCAMDLLLYLQLQLHFFLRWYCFHWDWFQWLDWSWRHGGVTLGFPALALEGFPLALELSCAIPTGPRLWRSLPEALLFFALVCSMRLLMRFWPFFLYGMMLGEQPHTWQHPPLPPLEEAALPGQFHAGLVGQFPSPRWLWSPLGLALDLSAPSLALAWVCLCFATIFSTPSFLVLWERLHLIIQGLGEQLGLDFAIRFLLEGIYCPPPCILLWSSLCQLAATIFLIEVVGCALQVHAQSSA